MADWANLRAVTIGDGITEHKTYGHRAYLEYMHRRDPHIDRDSRIIAGWLRQTMGMPKVRWQVWRDFGSRDLGTRHRHFYLVIGFRDFVDLTLFKLQIGAIPNLDGLP